MNVAAGQELCVWHDPARAEEAAAMRARGFETLAAKAAEEAAREVGEDLPQRPATLDDVVRWQAWIVDTLARKMIEVNRAKALSEVLSAMRGSLEKRDLAKDVEDLREQMVQLKRRGTMRAS
jgi:hypothetical protein